MKNRSEAVVEGPEIRQEGEGLGSIQKLEQKDSVPN